MNIGFSPGPDRYCNITAALPSTALHTEVVALATVAAPLMVGISVISASASPCTAVAACGVTLTPTALLDSALITIARLALPLAPKKADALLLRLASRPVPKNASR